MNTQILTRSGGSNGIGFAIPCELVRAFMEQASEGNDAFCTPLGRMSGQSVDADMADALGLGRSGRDLLSGMHAVSPVFKAGIAVGDVITVSTVRL